MARTKHVLKTKQEVLQGMFDHQVYSVGKQYPRMPLPAKLDLAEVRTKQLWLAKKKAELK